MGGVRMFWRLRCLWRFDAGASFHTLAFMKSGVLPLQIPRAGARRGGTTGAGEFLWEKTAPKRVYTQHGPRRQCARWAQPDYCSGSLAFRAPRGQVRSGPTTGVIGRERVIRTPPAARAPPFSKTSLGGSHARRRIFCGRGGARGAGNPEVFLIEDGLGNQAVGGPSRPAPRG